MNKLKKFKGFDKHLRIFLLISISLWLLVGILHASVLLNNDSIQLGDIVLPQLTSYFALFGVIWMSVMGVYYYRALAPNKDK